MELGRLQQRIGNPAYVDLVAYAREMIIEQRIAILGGVDFPAFDMARGNLPQLPTTVSLATRFREFLVVSMC